MSRIRRGTQDGRLHLVHPDGTGLARLDVDAGTSGIDAAFGPAWSPDGRWIVFSTVSDGTFTDLWIVAPDGTGLAKTGGLTTGAVSVNWGPAANP